MAREADLSSALTVIVILEFSLELLRQGYPLSFITKGNDGRGHRRGNRGERRRDGGDRLGCLLAVLWYEVHNGAVVVIIEVVAGAIWSAVRREACPPPPYLPAVYQGPLEIVGLPWSLACAASVCPSASSSSSFLRSGVW